MHLRIVSVYAHACIQALVRRVVYHVISQSLPSGPIEPFFLANVLLVISCGEDDRYF